MGVKNGSKMLHSVADLSFDEVATILRHRANKQTAERPPAIAHDSNWLARKLGSSKAGPVPNIMELVKAFSSKGVDNYVVVDGPCRHHSKKETIKRDAKIERAKIDVIVLRKKLLDLVEKSRSCSRMC